MGLYGKVVNPHTLLHCTLTYRCTAHPRVGRDHPEELRATGVWDAPWALLVLDDSRQACLEYANKQVRV
jgi:hypothetical protein